VDPGLGFTHICEKTRGGHFRLQRITISKRMRAKLGEVKTELMRRRHEPVPEQGQWLASVVRGHFAYYAVPGNITASTPSDSRRPGTGLRRFGAAASAAAWIGSE
jgi:hypothetical protein